MTENTAHPREAEGDTEVGSRLVHMKGNSRLPGHFPLKAGHREILEVTVECRL